MGFGVVLRSYHMGFVVEYCKPLLQNLLVFNGPWGVTIVAIIAVFLGSLVMGSGTTPLYTSPPRFPH